MRGKIAVIGGRSQRKTLQQYIMSVNFATDGELTHEEIMNITSQVLADSQKAIKEAVGDRGDHNMGVGIEKR